MYVFIKIFFLCFRGGNFYKILYKIDLYILFSYKMSSVPQSSSSFIGFQQPQSFGGNFGSVQSTPRTPFQSNMAPPLRFDPPGAPQRLAVTQEQFNKIPPSRMDQSACRRLVYDSTPLPVAPSASTLPNPKFADVTPAARVAAAPEAPIEVKNEKKIEFQVNIPPRELIDFVKNGMSQHGSSVPIIAAALMAEYELECNEHNPMGKDLKFDLELQEKIADNYERVIKNIIRCLRSKHGINYKKDVLEIKKEYDS